MRDRVIEEKALRRETEKAAVGGAPTKTVTKAVQEVSRILFRGIWTQLSRGR